MWISDKWRDYELLDCGGGERLERWGSYTLVRPDPQALWDTARTDPRWSRCDARYVRSESGGGRWERKNVPERWSVGYGDLNFSVGPMNFKHTGLFPEQAANWDFIRGQIAGAGRPVSVLNLFAYTGAATLAALKAGAEVCHVDAAKGMVNWARENAARNELENAPVRWIVDDCAKFAGRELRRGRRYDALIMDPPSYGRGPAGEVWKIEDGLWGFLKMVSGLLSDEPLFVLISSYTAGLSPSAIGYMAEQIFHRRGGGRCESQELGLPVTATGLALPAGAACRWISNG
ncbi:MAG: class I SAM-dependent methyltransferase [Firmicutes bacterium]|nr:class I SAM-dependent methyltransferase [Bacillota bacterium]